MKRALGRYRDIIIPKNDTLRTMSPESWSGYNTFTIVRHPIARVQSLQAMMLKLHGVDISIDSILDLVEDSQIQYYQFDDPQQYIKRHALPLTHPHYNVYRDGRINVNRWWRLEGIGTVLPQIEEYLKRGIKLPHINRTTDRKPNPLPHEVDRIKRLYRRDIEVFYPEWE